MTSLTLHTTAGLAALAEVQRLRSESDSALARMRESMAAAQAAASGDAERSKQLIATQGGATRTVWKRISTLGARS